MRDVLHIISPAERYYAELHVSTRARLAEIKAHHPIAQRLITEQLVTHSPVIYPYHCCTEEADVQGRPLDHITFVLYYAVLFAISHWLDFEQQAICAIAAAGHDYFQGHNHEAKSAEHVMQLLTQAQYAVPFVDAVGDAILSTSLYRDSDGTLKQPSTHVITSVCVASADLEASGGRPWPQFITTSLHARIEEARLKELFGPQFNDETALTVDDFLTLMHTLQSIFYPQKPYRLEIAGRLFPHMPENTKRLNQKMAEISRYSGSTSKKFKEWAAIVIAE